MVKQKRIVVALKAIEGKYPASQAKLEDVDELEEAYNDYHLHQHWRLINLSEKLLSLFSFSTFSPFISPFPIYLYFYMHQ